MTRNLTSTIYLDNHATTACDPRVVAAMLPYFSEAFGNPSSTTHRFGQAAAEAVETARGQIAELIGAFSNEVVFTSGATESNNLAIIGLARGDARGRKRIVTTPIEHKAVLAPCHELEKDGFEICVLPVDSTGRVDLVVAQDIINGSTLLVSVQAANNEIGTLQAIADLANIAHEQGAWMHTDAAQAVGKIPIDVAEWGIDLLSISGHKLYGPKGIGALFVSGGVSKTPLKPLVYGGGQEHDLRPGTLNVPGIVGLGEACRLCRDEQEADGRRIGQLRDEFERKMFVCFDGLVRNGSVEHRLPGSSSFIFPQVDAEALILNCPELALSTGSACTSGAIEPSHVLTSIGLSREAAYRTIRFGLGRFTDEYEIETAVATLRDRFRRLVDLKQ